MEQRHLREPFTPPIWGRNPHLQTIFGSLNIRLKNPNPVVNRAEEMIIETGDSRLLGYFTPQPAGFGRGLIALIHGWEGSADSTYILSTGRHLYDQGFQLFRLNLRDHGASHHLNEGLFHGARLEETRRAVAAIAGLAEGRPFYLIGFSLGGNFALRIAINQGQAPIANLRGVFAISPPLDPYRATLGIDYALPLYRYYFLAKWKKSLRIKETLFPDRYNFADLYRLKTCLAITEAIMPCFPEFPTYRDYFRRYTLTAESFASLSLPVTIFSSLDDPVIPPEEVLALRESDLLKIRLEKYGGHCGFLDPFPGGCFYEREIARAIGEDGV